MHHDIIIIFGTVASLRSVSVHYVEVTNTGNLNVGSVQVSLFWLQVLKVPLNYSSQQID